MWCEGQRHRLNEHSSVAATAAQHMQPQSSSMQVAALQQCTSSSVQAALAVHKQQRASSTSSAVLLPPEQHCAKQWGHFLVCLNLVGIDTCSSSISWYTYQRYTAAAAGATAAATIAVHTPSRAMRSAHGWAVTAVRDAAAAAVGVLTAIGRQWQQQPNSCSTCSNSQQRGEAWGMRSVPSSSSRPPPLLRLLLSPKHVNGGRTKSGFSSCCGALCW